MSEEKVRDGGNAPPSYKPVIKERQYGTPFQEIYGASMAKVYDREIIEFFLGAKSFTLPRYWETKERDVSKGNIWIARHYDAEGKKLFETLTVEPMDWGQYEIAVRMRLVEEEPSFIMSLLIDEFGEYETLAQGRAKFSGYHITEFGTFRGIATHGH